MKLKEIRHCRNIMYVLLISYVAGEQLITPMKAQPRVALDIVVGMGDNKNFMSRYIMRVIITIIDIITISV